MHATRRRVHEHDVSVHLLVRGNFHHRQRRRALLRRAGCGIQVLSRRHSRHGLRHHAFVHHDCGFTRVRDHRSRARRDDYRFHVALQLRRAREERSHRDADARGVQVHHERVCRHDHSDHRYPRRRIIQRRSVAARVRRPFHARSSQRSRVGRRYDFRRHVVLRYSRCHRRGQVPRRFRRLLQAPLPCVLRTRRRSRKGLARNHSDFCNLALREFGGFHPKRLNFCVIP